MSVSGEYQRQKDLREIDICDPLITPALKEGAVSNALTHSNAKSVEVASAANPHTVPQKPAISRQIRIQWATLEIRIIL